MSQQIYEKTIKSLEFRIAALAENLTNAKSKSSTAEDPLFLSQKINSYARTLTFLRREVENILEKKSQASIFNQSWKENKL